MTELDGNSGPQLLWNLLKEKGPLSKAQLAEQLGISDKSVYNYSRVLFSRGLIKELPAFGRTKVYATIDYVPSLQEEHEIIARWRIYSKKYNSHIPLGEPAVSYVNYQSPVNAPSPFTALEYLLKAPALLTYYAQINPKDYHDVHINEALNKLKETLYDAIEHLRSSIAIFEQLLTDPRYWDIRMLRQFPESPDYPSMKNLQAIIEKLQEEEFS